MYRYAHFVLFFSVLGVCAASCRGSVPSDDSKSGPTSGGPQEPLTIDDPLFSETTHTVAEWITPEWYPCETEESACGLPCPEDDLWVAVSPADFRNSAVCSACMAVEGPLGEVVVELIESCADACADGPGVLIVEAIAQACALLASRDLGEEQRENRVYYFTAIDKARFKLPVEPGDVLDINVRVLRRIRNMWKCSGVATVEGRLCCTAELMFTYKDL